MSFNEQQIRSVDERQSFSLSFSDDLCSATLKYLSIKDKLRLRSVSKQFQRCLFGEKLVFKIDFNRFNPKAVFKVMEIVDPKLIQTVVLSESTVPLSLCPNIEDLRNVSLSVVSQLRSQLKNLKKLRLNYSSDWTEDRPFLKQFVRNYKSLRHLSIDVVDCDRKEFCELLRQMTKLSDLIHFQVFPKDSGAMNLSYGDIFFGFGLTDVVLIETMVKKFQKLRSFGAFFKLEDIPIEKVTNQLNTLFKPLKKLRDLRRLNLEFSYSGPPEPKFTIIRFNPLDRQLGNVKKEHWFKFKTLNGFDNITHLRLGFHLNNFIKEDFQITSQVVTEALSYLPRLQYFDRIRISYDLKKILTNRFKRIERFHWNFIDDKIRKNSRKNRGFLVDGSVES